MIRLITLTSGSEGYLNFMGNEFGHPEWIDFPREQNGWSYHYARRQWHLVDDSSLKYEYLQKFDRDMLELFLQSDIAGPCGLQLLWIDSMRKLIAYRKNNYVFLYNFHPVDSYEGFSLPIHQRGAYRVIFSTDRSQYGGYERICENTRYHTEPLFRDEGGSEASDGIRIYIPSRTALVLRRETESSSEWQDLISDETDELSDEHIAIEQLVEAEKLAKKALDERKKAPKSRSRGK